MGMVSNTSRNKSFTCPICGKNFEDQLTLDAHKKMDHGPEGEEPDGVT
jgi:transcription elongation factor Elf1